MSEHFDQRQLAADVARLVMIATKLSQGGIRAQWNGDSVGIFSVSELEAMAATLSVIVARLIDMFPDSSE